MASLYAYTGPHGQGPSISERLCDCIEWIQAAPFTVSISGYFFFFFPLSLSIIDVILTTHQSLARAEQHSSTQIENQRLRISCSRLGYSRRWTRGYCCRIYFDSLGRIWILRIMHQPVYQQSCSRVPYSLFL